MNSGTDDSIDEPLNVEVSDINEGFTSGALSSGFESQTPIDFGKNDSFLSKPLTPTPNETKIKEKEKKELEETLKILRAYADEIDATNWMYEDIKVFRN